MNFVNAGEDYDIFEYQYAIVEGNSRTHTTNFR